MARGRFGMLYGVSLVFHAGVAFAIASIEPEAVHEATRITMREHKQKPDPKRESTPPPPPPVIAAPKPVRRAPKPEPKQEPAPAPAAPAPAAQAAPATTSAAPVADFGLAMMSGTGKGGIAVPRAQSGAAAPARAQKTVAPRALAKGAPEKDSCLEQLIKPKPLSIPQPVYADAARAAGITGKVRVELTLDETGAVVAVKVIEGLGYGLDEAALEAARNARFEPATRCGTPTRTTFTIGIRFSI
jgi:protein TonB